MKIKSILKIASLVVIQNITYSQHALVNKLSETITGQTDTAAFAPILKTSSGSYVVSSNQKVNSTQNDFKTTCLTGSVTTIWQQMYNANTKKAFTTTTTSDALGNIYVAGSTYINGTNGQDLTVMKYNSSGVQQWVKHYNGPGNNYDIASGIVVDNSGNVYVTGASVGFLFALVDFVTIKYNSLGTQQWVTRYNFSNGLDIPTDICLDNSGNVIVSGSSASNSMNSNSDFTTVKYNASTGSQIQVQRQSNTGTAQDKVLAQTKDASGNIYVTGVTSLNGTNYDVQTIKYDANMNFVWVNSFDGYGNYDQGADIAIDNSGNVIVTGYTTKSNLTKELLVLSYSSSGSLNWKAVKQPKINASDAEGLKIKIKSNNEIFIGGNYTINNNVDMVVLRFDNLGNNTLEKTYNGISNLNDQLSDLLVDGNYIVVSGRTFNGIIDQNVTIKYEYKDFTQSLTSSSTHGNYDANKILIYFNKSALKMNVINDKNILFGKLIDFVQDSTCSKINQLINKSLKCQDFNASKIFYNLTESDSISISRQGDNVKVPPFYGALIIETPNNFDILMASDTLSHIKPDINYANLNQAYELTFVPNDAKFQSFDQASLAPTPTFNSGDVNCTQAWNYTKGKPYINVGVYDSGVDFNNTDLNGVVVGGFDYWLNTSISATDQPDHGTGCAGIIAAKTNNGTGVAGIAGGDASLNQNGVSIFNMRITGNGNITQFISTQKIAQAIVNGASGANIGGNALHVMSNSWTLNSLNVSYDGFIMDGMNFANRNGVVFVESSGNNGSGTPAFPSGLKEQVILCVGASGMDGHFQQPSNGDNFTTNHGYPMDLVAPGTSQLVSTTKVGTNNFGTFNGTSASAPHVAGAAALLLSYYNLPTASWDNLTHEDCEVILQKGCTDLANSSYGESPGWDGKTGHGRLNIGASLAMIEKPKYKIRHIDPSHYTTSSSKQVNTIVSNQLRFFAGNSSIAAGNYYMDIFETITTLNYSLGSSEQIVDAWPMYKASTGTAYYPPDILTDEPWYCELISYNSNQAILKTYTCFLKFNIIGQPINYQYPMASNGVNSAFSLLTYDPNAVSVKENNINISTFNVYPIPAKDNFTVAFNSNTASKGKIIIHDVVGKTIEEKNITFNQGVNTHTFSTATLNEGIYFVNLQLDGSKTLVKKIIVE